MLLPHGHAISAPPALVIHLFVPCYHCPLASAHACTHSYHTPCHTYHCGPMTLPLPSLAGFGLAGRCLAPPPPSHCIHMGGREDTGIYLLYRVYLLDLRTPGPTVCLDSFTVWVTSHLDAVPFGAGRGRLKEGVTWRAWKAASCTVGYCYAVSARGANSCRLPFPSLPLHYRLPTPHHFTSPPLCPYTPLTIRLLRTPFLHVADYRRSRGHRFPALEVTRGLPWAAFSPRGDTIKLRHALGALLPPLPAQRLPCAKILWA